MIPRNRIGLGKRGIWLPSIFNILIVVLASAIILIFFWWLLFGGKSEALDQISETERAITHDSELYSLLRASVIKDFDYSQSHTPEAIELSKELSEQGKTFADVIELAYSDSDNFASYRQIILAQLEIILYKMYGSGNYGFFIDYPEGKSINGYIGSLSSGEVSYAYIPTQDSQLIKVRLITKKE